MVCPSPQSVLNCNFSLRSRGEKLVLYVSVTRPTLACKGGPVTCARYVVCACQCFVGILLYCPNAQIFLALQSLL